MESDMQIKKLGRLAFNGSDHLWLTLEMMLKIIIIVITIIIFLLFNLRCI
jgi:hypothetical protein